MLAEIERFVTLGAPPQNQQDKCRGQIEKFLEQGLEPQTRRIIKAFQKGHISPCSKTPAGVKGL